MFQQRNIDRAVEFIDADDLAEIADRLRRISSPPQPAKRRHARIIPAVDKFLLHQLQQFAFAHHGIGQIQPGKFDLLGMIDAQLVKEPVVQRPMILKFQRADRMRDAFDRILKAVRPVVHRVNAPRVAGAVMLGMQNAIHHRVAHIQIRMRHIDLCLERSRPVGEFPCLHPRKQVKIFFDAAIAIRAVLARRSQRAAILPGLLGRQVAHIRLALLDQLNRPLIHLLEIIRCEKQTVVPVPPQPADIIHDRIDVFLLFLGRIGIVKPQIAVAAEFCRDAEIQADALGVADVQVAVRLRRETRSDPPIPFTCFIVIANNIADKISPLSLAFIIHIFVMYFVTHTLPLPNCLNLTVKIL